MAFLFLHAILSLGMPITVEIFWEQTIVSRLKKQEKQKQTIIDFTFSQAKMYNKAYLILL